MNEGTNHSGNGSGRGPLASSPSISSSPAPAANGQRITVQGAGTAVPTLPAPTLAPGDLLLMSPDTGPADNHVAVYLGGDQVIEVTHGPANILSLSDAIADDAAVAVCRHPGLTPAYAEVLIRWLRTQEGRPYDPPGSVSHTELATESWFAPEFVLIAFQNASLPLINPNHGMRPDMTMPLNTVQYVGHRKHPAQPAPAMTAPQGRQMDFLEPPGSDRDRMIPTGQYGMTYDAQYLEVGDMIVVNTAGLVSEAIRQRTSEPASHVALFVGDGYVIEAVGSGVERHELGTLLNNTHFAAAYRYVGLTTAERNAIKNFAYDEWRKGTPYDFIAIASLQRFNDTQALFCSELVFKAFEAAGIVLGNYATSTPGAVINMTGVEYLGHLPAGPEARGQAMLRRRGRAMQAGAAATVGELGFEIAKSITTGDAGDITYSFDRLDGIYARDHVYWSVEERRSRQAATFQDAAITSRQTQWDLGRITASIPIRFSYNGDYIANVRLSAPDDDEHFGYSMRLTGEITQHPNAYRNAAGQRVSRVDLIVKHVIDYDWLGESFYDDTASITEYYRIYSDGSVWCTVVVDGTWWFDADDALSPFRIDGGALHVNGPMGNLAYAIQQMRESRASGRSQTLDLDYSPDLPGGMSMHWSSEPFIVHGSGTEPTEIPADNPALVASYRRGRRGRSLSSNRIENAVQAAMRHGASEEEARQFFAHEASVARSRRAARSLTATNAFPEITLIDEGSWITGVLGEVAEAAFPASTNPLQIIFDFCTNNNLTIALGIAVSGGFYEAASAGFGIVVSSGNRIGYYGSISAGTGWIFEASSSIQLTVIHGGPSTFTGTSFVVGGNVSGSEGPGGGFYIISSMNGNPIGWTAEISFQLGAPGVSAVEFTAMVQQTAAQFTRVSTQGLGYAAALSGPVGNGMIGGLPMRQAGHSPTTQPQGWALRGAARPGDRRRIWA